MRRRYPYLAPLRLPHACVQMVDQVVDPDTAVWYLPWAREYVIDRHDAGFQVIEHCPFCGARLPAALREEFWERQGDAELLTPGFDPAGDAWWLDDAGLLVPTVEVEPDVPPADWPVGDAVPTSSSPSTTRTREGRRARALLQAALPDEISSAVQQWVTDACASLRGASHTYFEQIDLDDLLGVAYDVQTAVPTGLDVLTVAHAALGGADDVAPRLAVTLADSATLDPRPPALDDVASLHDALHPPGLYLVRSTLEHLTGGTEEYRVGYDPPVRELGAGAWVEASYSCYRDEDGRRHGWPFARTLWFDVRHGVDLDDLGGCLDELAQAVGRHGGRADWRLEHQRADLYAAAVQDVRLHDLLYAAVRHEPERVIAGWVVSAAIEHGDGDGDARWLALESAHVDTRRVDQLLVLRAVRGGAVVTKADVDEWPDWLQRRVASSIDRLDVLRLLAEHGRSKRVRRTAGQRADAWDGPT